MKWMQDVQHSQHSSVLVAVKEHKSHQISTALLPRNSSIASVNHFDVLEMPNLFEIGICQNKASQLNHLLLHAQLIGFMHMANVHVRSLISKLHVHLTDHGLPNRFLYDLRKNIRLMYRVSTGMPLQGLPKCLHTYFYLQSFLHHTNHATKHCRTPWDLSWLAWICSRAYGRE